MDLEYLTNKDVAIGYLASYLKEGTLVLFLGAGVSIDLGLPNWATLVNLVREKKGLGPILAKASAEELQLAADEVRLIINSNTEYLRIIKECLYSKMPELSSSILANRLLISLGALFMSSRRGSVKRVVTLNFDSMLEWYLQLCGFDVRVVHKFPHLEGAEDIIVYHPHGFFPHPSMALPNSNFILFDLKQANKRLDFDPNSEDFRYLEKTRNYLRTGVCLFVGMSEATFDDRVIGPLLTNVGEEIKRDHQSRPTGFWFVKDDNFTRVKEHFIDNNVVPIAYARVEDIPDFLLEIARHGAKGILV